MEKTITVVKSYIENRPEPADPFEYKAVSMPYKYGDFEPTLSEKAVKRHYTQNYYNYVSTINDSCNIGKASLADVVATCLRCKFTEEEILAIGGAYNHELFFNMFTPKGSSMSKEFEDIIDATFGSVKDFKQLFINECSEFTGSGWVWLVKYGEQMEIVNTNLQYNPLMTGLVPILGLDMWEHAYIDDYETDKEKYATAMFDHINWEFCEMLYRYSSALDL